MERKIYLAICLISITVASLFANDVDALWDTANMYYQKGNYESAIKYYEQITQKDKESFELYYNIGNAYFKQNYISKAILYYEKARLIKPNDDDLNYNLQLANTYIVDKINAIPILFLKRWVNKFIGVFPSNIWAIISVSMFLLSLISFLFYILSKNIVTKKIGFYLGIVLFLISGLDFWCSYASFNKVEESNHAIIMSPTVTIKGSPSDSGTSLFVLHEGTKVEVLDKISSWYHIRLADGNKGWVPKNMIEII